MACMGVELEIKEGQVLSMEAALKASKKKDRKIRESKRKHNWKKRGNKERLDRWE